MQQNQRGSLLARATQGMERGYQPPEHSDDEEAQPLLEAFFLRPGASVKVRALKFFD